MCGVVGVLDPRGVDPARLDAATDALAHRGPDGRGTWRGARGTVGLGHRRLALVDPQGGAQPVSSEDGRVVAVVNGEFYDDAAWRERLSGRHQFRSRCDSELLVHLYEELGLDLLPQLRGEFAFVLWDGRRLVAARDRFGVRSLVWGERDGALWVGSEVAALRAAGFPARWDPEALRRGLATQYVPDDRTLFAGIASLPPGGLLVAEGGRVRVTRWWVPSFPERPGRSDPRAVRAALDDAVRVRLRGDARVGVQLSGGLDSTAVAALAARASPGLPAFTVGFDGEGWDEAAQAQDMARQLDLDWKPLRLSADALIDALPDAIAHGGGLCNNAHVAAKYLLSAHVKAAGVSVVLTGEGSDEVFRGYPFLRAEVAELTEDHHGSRGVMVPGLDAPVLGELERFGSVPVFVRAKAALGGRVAQLLRPGWVDPDPFRPWISSLPAGHPVDRAVLLWCRTALSTYILRTLGDAMELAHGVESRLPFLDREVFAVARTHAVADAFTGGTTKAVLREALRGVVPEAVRVRPKHPFMAPPLGSTPRGRAFLRRWLVEADVPFLDRGRTAVALERMARLDPEARQAWEPAWMVALSASILHVRHGMST